jgi:hypothetical protein
MQEKKKKPVTYNINESDVDALIAAVHDGSGDYSTWEKVKKEAKKILWEMILRSQPWSADVLDIVEKAKSFDEYMSMMDDELSDDDEEKVNPVCVVSRSEEGIMFRQVHHGQNPTIRTYLPGAVDGRWGPLLSTANEVLSFLAENEDQPCSVPIALAKQLFNPAMPFAGVA